MLTVGSSPLMRRKLSFLVQLVLTIGLIPAHAGKTPSKPRAISQPGTHPRSRGENWAALSSMGSHGGSSPLTRGKQIHYLQTPPCPRLIPAHAGKTLHDPAHRSASKAHPHSRGENAERGAQILGYLGSSPLMRGKLRSSQSDMLSGGLIPAHAGKT